MKKINKFFILFSIIFLAACGTGAKTWQDHYDLGMRYLSEGNYEEAILSFTAAIEIDAKRIEAFIGRGDAYFAFDELEGHFESAIADFEIALGLDEMYVDAYLKIADAYIQLDDIDSAIAILEKGYKKTSSNEILSKMQELQNQRILTVLTKQEIMRFDYDGRNPDLTYDIYLYDENGYMIRKETSEENGEIYHTDAWTYDESTGKWTHTFNSKYDESYSEVLDEYYPGTKFEITTATASIVAMTTDPFPEEKTELVYNSNYGSEKYVDVDWYTAKYTYDAEGNAICIESYSKEGTLLGICNLEYSVIDLR